MKKFSVIILLINVFLFQCIYASAILNENERIHEHKLSDKEHYTDIDNDQKLEHNAEYDHEAFLGREEAEKFKDLTPEESRERLGKIVDKIDTNNDGFVTALELQNWIKNISKVYLLKDVEIRWKSYDPNNTGSFSLDTLLDINYGALKLWSDEEKENKKDELKAYEKLMNRDRIRFKAADSDNNGKLNKTEYGEFLHPEEVPHMRDLVINETIEDLDKNQDGFVNIDEYLTDIYTEKQDEEPEWVKTERENFAKYRDLNRDGKLDREEIKAWILPTDYDHTEAEAKHLIYHADSNHDGKLTKEEILDNSNVFVSSKATAYGEVMYKHVDL